MSPFFVRLHLFKLPISKCLCIIIQQYDSVILCCTRDMGTHNFYSTDFNLKLLECTSLFLFFPSYFVLGAFKILFCKSSKEKKSSADLFK